MYWRMPHSEALESIPAISLSSEFYNLSLRVFRNTSCSREEGLRKTPPKRAATGEGADVRFYLLDR